MMKSSFSPVVTCVPSLVAKGQKLEGVKLVHDGELQHLFGTFQKLAGKVGIGGHNERSPFDQLRPLKGN